MTPAERWQRTIARRKETFSFQAVSREVELLNAKLAEVTAQRDKLLAALKGIVDRSPDTEDENHAMGYEEARKAIAQAESGVAK